MRYGSMKDRGKYCGSSLLFKALQRKVIIEFRMLVGYSVRCIEEVLVTFISLGLFPHYICLHFLKKGKKRKEKKTELSLRKKS